MEVITLLIWLAVLVIAILVAFWIIAQVPMDPKAKQLINILVVVVVAIIAIYLLLQIGGGLRIPS
jgi:hypothetical protein